VESHDAGEPLVSIIIPAFNAERFLAATIESVLAQDWSRREIIVVDDGSVDGTLDVIRRYDKDGVRAIAKANGGGPAARNTGYAASRGHFIQFLDHDDLLAPDKISQQIRCAAGDESPIAGVWTRFRADVSGAFGGWQPPEQIRHDWAPLDWLIASPFVPTCAWLTPRALVEAAGPWNDSLKSNPDDDGEFFMRVLERSSRVVFCERARSYFRAESTASAGHVRNADALRSIFAICQGFERIVSRRGLTDEARHACAKRYLAFMYMAHPLCPELIAEAEARVTALGFDPNRVPNTPAYERLSRLTGWRTAKRLQRAWQSAREMVLGRPASRY
jgi:glycosyltransferase involved in cell wall biosynthesis